jgi:hypothetical protein
MRIAFVLAAAMALVPACKSSKQPENYQEMKKKVPDAKPTLYVVGEDKRYVASSGSEARQVRYYSAKNDTTYVVDEKTGKVVSTFKGKEVPGVVVIDRPVYEPPPLKTDAPKEEGSATEEGCGCAPSKGPKPDGCGCGTEGCGDTAPEACGCGEGGGEGCGCGK